MGRVSEGSTDGSEEPAPRAPRDIYEAKKGRAVLAPYDEGWPVAFRMEAARLRGALGQGLVLHHIGSTAVPGMLAKPIVDMLGEVSALSDADALAPHLETLGYEAMGAYGIDGRRYFRRSIAERRTHHLHVFERGSTGALRHLALRDYLRAKPAEARAYIAEKQRAALTDDYQSAKSAYVAELETRALAWAARPRVVASINDESGMRCVDIQAVPGGFAWIECRRDPEDSFGWRPTGAGEWGFDTADAARGAAARHCAWVSP